MRRRAWAGARLLGGVLILAVLVRWLGAEPFVDGLRGLGPGTLLTALAIGAATTVCSAWRWRVVAAALGVGLPLPAATAAYYRSQFLNSALPGGVLGDVHRGLRHGVDAGDLGRGLRAVVWERVAGQAVQAAVAVAVLLTLPSPVPAAVPAVATAVAVAGGVLLVTGRGVARHGASRPAGALRTAGAEARGVLLQPATARPVLLASLLVVGGHLGTFLLAARAAGVDGPALELLPLALVVLLAAAIPLNVGGWGPREGVAAWVFAATPWGAAAGASVATAFGVLTLVAVLPGAVVLLAARRQPGPRGPRLPAPRRAAEAGCLQSATREDGAAHG
ncbi:lysylphosphatidylglycerol synthase transmembrane domain-containing protein [Geodermatophilus sp. SYSU D00705]